LRETSSKTLAVVPYNGLSISGQVMVVAAEFAKSMKANVAPAYRLQRQPG
jgi:hypothetical protein